MAKFIDTWFIEKKKEELKLLADLKTDGIITAEEKESKERIIIDEIRAALGLGPLPPPP